MEQQISLTLLQKFDSRATSPLSKDRAAYFFIKQVVDFNLAALALILLSPVLAVIAIAIKLDSPGPIFFKQDRVGTRRWRRNGFAYWQRDIFKCVKFRTMVVNADTAIHQAYMKALIANDRQQMEALQGGQNSIKKLKNDPRVTRVGKILRKYSLDEIPQFYNVLCGNMSLVGPRPAIPYEVAMYAPWHLHRLQAKPGVTGLQQVTCRSTADFEEQVRIDLDYIRRQSVWLDLKILIKTPLVVLNHKGAV